jgi:hypothetical protein
MSTKPDPTTPDPRKTYVCRQGYGAAEGRQLVAGQRLKGSDPAVIANPELWEPATTSPLKGTQ